MRGSSAETISLNGRILEYRIVESASAKHLRIRVRPECVEVLKPKDRSSKDVQQFLREKESWITSQLDRVRKLNGIRRATPVPAATMLFRGERVRIIAHREPAAAINRVRKANDSLILCAGGKCKTPLETTLTNWLRRQAREEITRLLPNVCRRLNRSPARVFVMGQRTKWGNCSANKILSFNWRLIMAPPFVMQYIITHEVAHLVVPDHSAKFWLTVKSHFPDFERAKQWLAANGLRLLDRVAVE